MNSSHNKQVAMEEVVNEEAGTELKLLKIHGARTGEDLKLIPGTSFIDDRSPVRGRRK